MYILLIIFSLSAILSRLNTSNYFIDILSQLSFQILLGGIVLFLILTLLKKPKMSFISMILCLLLATDILIPCKNCKSSFKKNTEDLKKIRLMTFNTSYSPTDSSLPEWFVDLERFLIQNKNVEIKNDKSLDSLKKLVLIENPDLVQFQEVTSEFEKKIKIMEANFPYKHIVKYKFPGIANSIILSKYPLEKDDDNSSLVKIIMDDTKVNIMSVHLYSTLNQKRYDIAGEQTKMITNAAKNIKGDLIIVGDLNMTPVSKRYVDFLRESNLYTDVSFSNPTFTWPSFLPYYLGIQIDHILFSENVKMVRKKTTETLGSDHRPLVVDLIFM